MQYPFLRTLLIFLAVISNGFTFTQSGQIEVWITNPDRSALFKRQPEEITFTDRISGRSGQAIVIDDSQEFQIMDGFGFALTGGSAELLMKMSKDARKEILEELFRYDENNIGVSYIRLTIGASDLNSFVFYHFIPFNIKWYY